MRGALENTAHDAEHVVTCEAAVNAATLASLLRSGEICVPERMQATSDGSECEGHKEGNREVSAS